MNIEHLCMGCMGDKGSAAACPLCGWAEGTPPELPVQLGPRTVICEKYLLGKVLGQGGFGITYLAWDLMLNRKLAIKEYFPREICGRGRDDLTLHPLSQRNQQDYQYGLTKFVEEGRNLARFRDFPGIVSLLDFFEANGTAYIVMAYMEGMTFKQYLLEQPGGRITFDRAVSILNPVMDALREVHRIGMLHRDISPDNIYLTEDRQVKILDFGATRYAMRDQSQNLTVLIKPGYAPLEQYSSGGKQGPWSDVYALGATFYRALSSRPPSEAPDRLVNDDLLPPSKLNISIAPQSEAALLKALAVHWQSRFQSMEDFQNAVVPQPKEPPVPVPPRPETARNPMLLILAALFFVTTLAFAGLWLSSRNALRSAEARINQLANSGPFSNRPADNEDVEALRKQIRDLSSERDDLQQKLQFSNAHSNAELASRNGEPSRITNQLGPGSQRNSTTQQNGNNAPDRVEQTVTRAAVRAPALSLVYFYLYSSDGSGKGKVGPSEQFRGNALRYVLCQLGGPNPEHENQDLATSIAVRFFDPTGALRRVVPEQVTVPKSEALWTSTAMWGSEKPGTFQPGKWRIEIWSGESKIGEKTFLVN
jgi:serine/threonine protein kinase